MTAYVVDSSIALKWFLREPDRDAALVLLRRGFVLHAPTLLLVEFDNVLAMHVGASKLTPGEANQLRQALRELPVVFHPVAPLLDSAFRLAIHTKQTVYDCLLLALAITLPGRVVTADARFHRALHSAGLGDRMLLLGEPG